MPERTNKLALVTGGAGFVGSHLCEALVGRGYSVISLDNYFAGSVANHVTGVVYREGHTKHIEQLIPEAPEIVYHLGEYARVEKSFEDIETVWDLNTAGTFAVLEFCRRRGSKIVYAGSSTKFSDSGVGASQSPYAWTKASNTDLVQQYAKWFGVPYAITYFYNVYGPRERGRGPYATLIGIYKEEYQQGQPLTVVSPGTQTRNFTHVADIVDGLILVGEKGAGDEFGIGHDTEYSIRAVAEMFGGEIIMLPPRPGNRTGSGGVHSERTRSLGWTPKRHLEDDIREFKKTVKRGTVKEKSILVFSTTFHPITGPAEDALCALMMQMPHVHFDIVTTLYDKSATEAKCPVANATVYRVGFGTPFDKYLLPYFGAKKAQELMRGKSYLFAWSLMASYGALAGVFLKRTQTLPLLITLANQKLSGIPFVTRILLRFILGNADQVYASSVEQQRHVVPLMKRTQLSKSLGAGDAFANQIRFAYVSILTQLTK